MSRKRHLKTVVAISITRVLHFSLVATFDPLWPARFCWNTTPGHGYIPDDISRQNCFRTSHNESGNRGKEQRCTTVLNKRCFDHRSSTVRPKVYITYRLHHDFNSGSVSATFGSSSILCISVRSISPSFNGFLRNISHAHAHRARIELVSRFSQS